ncbi:hypothetical protein ACJZ2D_016181 [Fusarium nematophilum]
MEDAERLHPGPLTRLLTILVVKARRQKYLRPLWNSSPGLLFVFNVCIKVKPFENLAEAHAMQLVARHTSVPVPKVKWHGMDGIAAQKSPRHGYWTSFAGWLPSFTLCLPPKERALVTLTAAPFATAGLHLSSGGGHIPRRATFMKHANGANIDIEYKDLPPEVSGLFAFYQQSSYNLVLTHGDLSSLNVLVRGDEVVGIVDWETAGWFPSYWEYTCAKNVNPQNMFWADEVDRFIAPMPNEREMEGIRRQYFGVF